jgi:beta-glucanase (GH16 family)
MLKNLNMFNLYLLLTISLLSGLASAQDIDFQPFGDAFREGDTYRFPTGSETWAGFANANTALYPISISQPGEITFSAYVPSGGSASVYFRFEKNPYPDTDPSYNTSSVIVTGDVSQSYRVSLASQGSNTFRSFLLYVNDQDVDIVITDIILSVDSGSTGGTFGETCSSPAVCHDEEGGHSIGGGEDTNHTSENCIDTVSGDPVDDTKWFHQIIIPSSGSWYNNEVQHYTSCLDNSYVSNGTLKIVAKSESFWDQGHHKDYTSARLNSKFAFQYGRVEFKAKMPEGVGTWPAVWMLGKDITENGAYYASNFGATSWPATGEIDILEHWGRRQGFASSAMHTTSSYGATENHGEQYISSISSQFHDYEMYWDKNEIIFSVNDIVHYTYKPTVKNAATWPYDKEFFLLLNVAVEDGGFPDFDQAAMELDYIRVYNLDGNLIFYDEFNSGDSDGDGFDDDVDAFPNDPDEHLDTDGDNIGNKADPDDDNDGVADNADAFSLDSSEWLDTDGDGIGNNADTDDDGDSYADNIDACPLDSNEYLDTDEDGICNKADSDDDNDGILDEDDVNPLVPDLVLKKQIISVTNSPNAVPGGQVSLDISYDVSTNDNLLSGLGLNVHYDSNVLEFKNINNQLLTDIAFNNYVSQKDDSNFDGNASTDEFVSIAWASIFSGGWPNTNLPTSLFTINFNVNDSVSPSSPSTTIEFSSSSVAPFYTLEAANYVMDITDLTWDFDDNGVADTLTDGLLLVRHSFGLFGDALTADVIALDSPLTPSEVENRVAKAYSIADIDNNGEVDALSDGLLLLRYLFTLRGQDLVTDLIALDANRKDHSEIEQYIQDHMPAGE